MLMFRYHRRALAEHRGNPGDELAYIDQVVEEDPKNYHAWSHRQWLLQVGWLIGHLVCRSSLLSVFSAGLVVDYRKHVHVRVRAF